MFYNLYFFKYRISAITFAISTLLRYLRYLHVIYIITSTLLRFYIIRVYIRLKISLNREYFCCEKRIKLYLLILMQQKNKLVTRKRYFYKITILQKKLEKFQGSKDIRFSIEALVAVYN